MPGTTSIIMVNARVEGFIRAAALELKRGILINAVSPVFVKETSEALKLNITETMTTATVLIYKESIEGGRNREVLDVRKFV